MVTKIKPVRDINRAIYYNEHKVTEGVAQCLYAGNFLKDACELTLLEKKEWFARQMCLDQRIENRALHIPISFAPGELIPTERSIDIAREYMDRIGFGDQPYLVYRHSDTAVPHLHIVTTTIRPDGSPIYLDFIGRDKSEPARKAIEEKYGLVRAQGQKKQNEYQLHPLAAERLQYGKRPTKQAITNVLSYVLEKYRFQSLPELNGILKLYNLKADPGKPGSRINQHGGLLYQMLNEKGEGIGIPIKASLIYFNPGLKWLDEKFRTCRKIEPAELQRLRQTVDAAIGRHPRNWPGFLASLRLEQISAVPYINAQQSLYGISFVDLRALFVVKSSDLGKGYSGTAILRKLGLDHGLNPIPQQTTLFPGQNQAIGYEKADDLSRNETLDILFRNEAQAERLPYELTQKANKKRKDSSKHL